MSLFSFIQNFSHKREMAESMDEILIGQIMAVMVPRGYPVIGIQSDADFQMVRFYTPGDAVLHSVIVRLNRLTGGLAAKVVGNKATLSVMGECKNFLSDPDDLLNMVRTDMQNILKIPVLTGGIKLNHQLNSVFATSTRIIDIKDRGTDLSALEAELMQAVSQVRDALQPYKRGAR